MGILDIIDRAVDATASLLTSNPSNRKSAKLAIYFLLAFALVGIPYSFIRHIKTSGFHVVSVEREKKAGLEFAKRIQKHMTLLPQNDRISSYVSGIGEQIADQNNPWKFDFSFAVISDYRTINAFAVPGGKIYITAGLLYKLDNEAELAAVLGHEVAHVSRRHYARNLGRQMRMSWVKKFLGGTDKVILEAGSFFTANITLLSMRQKDELEADHQSAIYMYELGYDPEAAVTLSRKFLNLEKEMPALMRMLALTHPPSNERLAALMKLRDSLPEKEGLKLKVEQFKKKIMLQSPVETQQTWLIEQFKKESSKYKKQRKKRLGR
jgi:predicted Zn-dependent protease